MRIITAISGGVDSAVAAWLLRREGHDVIGFTMLLGANPEQSELIRRRAGNAAELAGIPLRVENLAEDFEREVVAVFCREYVRGRTPNPCVICNPRIKFAQLLRIADELGANAIATGHYARAARDPVSGRVLLLRAADRRKDQSYFLAGLSQEQLARAVFPLAELTKEKTRELAAEFGYCLDNYAESQDFCFVGESHYADFLRDRFDARFEPGRIVDQAGKVLGRHGGVHLFTIGQRRGLRIAAPKPLYVIRLEPETNTVVAGPRAATFAAAFRATEVNWVGVSAPPAGESFGAAVKIRAAHPAAPARIQTTADANLLIEFDQPQHAITPGQAAVLYRDDLVLAGGVIDAIIPEPRFRT